MKLDRNAPGSPGKYAVVRLRKIAPDDNESHARLDALVAGGFVEFAKPGAEDEFFVVKLKDKFAAAALTAYAQAAWMDGDEEYAREVTALAERAAAHPNRKKPD